MAEQRYFHGGPKAEGEIEPDPDCDLPGLSFACARARVVAVHKLPGKLIKKARKMLLATS